MESDDQYAPYQDPGWWPTLKPPDGVQAARMLWLGLVWAGLLFGFVLLFVVEIPGEVNAGIAAVLAAVGMAAVAAARWSRAGSLDATSSATLATTYRTYFFVCFSVSELPLVAGVTLSLVRDGLWPYLVALPFYLTAMTFTAPNRRNLERKQQELYAQGSTLSLGRALARRRSKCLTQSGLSDDGSPRGFSPAARSSRCGQESARG